MTEVRQNITTTLALSISYDYSHDSGGPGTTDRIASINLLYQLR